MTVQKFVFLICDFGDLQCANESPSTFTETEARRLARAAGWKVGHNRDADDICPFHKESA